MPSGGFSLLKKKRNFWKEINIVRLQQKYRNSFHTVKEDIFVGEKFRTFSKQNIT